MPELKPETAKQSKCLSQGQGDRCAEERDAAVLHENGWG